jgi:ribonuclease BN (tRNA processing enzyme)
MPLRPRDLRVRMYRVGFGDCFLLSLPLAGAHRHILVDLGVHPQGDIGTLDAAFADVVAETGGRLAAVVATHEHADHISGFGKFAHELGRLQIEEVWMPWALDPADVQAEAMRLQRLSIAEALEAHLTALGAANPGVMAALANLRGNDEAVRALRRGFGAAGAQVRYFEASVGPRAVAPVENLKVQVLGPPRDEAFLRQMDPPASQRFLRMDGGRARPANGIEPFTKHWIRDDTAAVRRELGFTSQDEKSIEDLRDSAEELALALNRVVNNTSLVLLFEFRGQKLLFTGDAQWGEWRSWLERQGSAGLLAEVSFLKVAHHGSHNATPRQALEGLRRAGCVAMVSTQSKPWPSIPQAALLTALEKQTRGRVARSDALARPGAPVASGPAAGAIGRPFRSEAGKPWVDWVTQV